MKRFAMALICAASLTACGTTRVGLKYAPSTTPSTLAASAPIDVGSFVDQRGEPATFIGAIRGGFGNPLKTLDAARPVSELVRDAFADGLHARGGSVGSTAAPLQLAGVIRKLDCNQMARREANVEVEISVIERASGKARFVRTYSASYVDGSLMSLKTGVFADVEDLRALTEKTLRETVDKALDDGALRAALKP